MPNPAMRRRKDDMTAKLREAESQYDNVVREYYEAEEDFRGQFHAQYATSSRSTPTDTR